LRTKIRPAAGPSLTGGLLLAAANPKAYVAIAAVFAGSRLDGLSPAAEALLKTALLALMVVLIHLGWLLAGAALSRVLRDPVASRVVNVMLAAILVATSVIAVLPR
jgi:threonine/homoserine/homoserine lactone efflux protein